MAADAFAPATNPIGMDGATALISQCAFCKRFRAGNPPTCAAFPDGIPDEILRNEFDHREPVAGDRGLRYEPIDRAAATRADDVIRRADTAAEIAEGLAEEAGTDEDEDQDEDQ